MGFVIIAFQGATHLLPRLVEALRRHRNLPLPNLPASLVDTVRSFSPHEQQDDIAMLVAKCK